MGKFCLRQNKRSRLEKQAPERGKNRCMHKNTTSCFDSARGRCEHFPPSPQPDLQRRACNHHHINHRGDLCLMLHTTQPLLAFLLLVRSARTGARTRGCSTPACKRSGQTYTTHPTSRWFRCVSVRGRRVNGWSPPEVCRVPTPTRRNRPPPVGGLKRFASTQPRSLYHSIPFTP